MTSKTIMIHVPSDANDIKIIKGIDMDYTNSIQIDISKDLYNNRGIYDDHIFFCFQHKQKTVFYPMDYAYIESTSNHYSLWHSANPNNPVLSIYTQSLGNIHTKLYNAGLKCLWRVHASYIVNCHYIKSFKNDKIILKGQKRPIPISKEYKKDFLSRITVF